MPKELVLTGRMNVLLNIFLEAQRPLTSVELVKELHVSSRTLRTMIKELNEILAPNHGFVRNIRGTGYQLTIDHPSAFNTFLKNITERRLAQHIIPSLPEERTNYIIRRLICATDYVKIEDLANELYISKQTVTNDLKQVRSILKKYHLKLCSKPSYGMRIEGSELQKRFCYSEYIRMRQSNTLLIHIYPEEQQVFGDIDLETIKQILLKHILNSQLRITDISLKNLTIHIAIAIKRIREGNKLENDFFLEQKSLESLDRIVAEKIVKDLEQSFQLSFPTHEVDYILLHLISNKRDINIKKEPFYDEADRFVKELIENIDKKYGFGFWRDQKLIHDLILHIKPFLNRVRYHMNIRNPFLKKIKENYPLAFEMALVGVESSSILSEYTVNEEEIAYIAMHLGAAMERQQKRDTGKKRVILVCGSGVGTARLWESKLRTQVGDFIEVVDVLSFLEYNVQPILDADVVISTVPLEGKNIPVIVVNAIPNQQDLVRITESIHKNDRMEQAVFDTCFSSDLFQANASFASKEEAINTICDDMENKGIVTQSFRSFVWQREKLSPTSIGARIAIPHPIQLSSHKTAIYVTLLKEPLYWGNDNEVQVIFMLAIHMKDYDMMGKIYNKILQLMNDPSLMNRLLQCQTFDDFRQNFMGL